MGHTGGKVNSRGACGLGGQEAEDGAGLMCVSPPFKGHSSGTAAAGSKAGKLCSGLQGGILVYEPCKPLYP